MITLTLILMNCFLSVPEPGIVLHGVVRDDSCLFHEETTLTWTLYPVQGGGDTLSYQAVIVPIVEAQSLYSYWVLIPLATYMEAIPPPSNAIMVDEHPEAYVREIRVAGSNLVKKERLYLSDKDRGRFQYASFTW